MTDVTVAPAMDGGNSQVRSRHWGRRILLGLAVLVLLLIVASPWWFSWLLRGIAGRTGVAIEKIERAGWSAVHLRRVEANPGAAQIRIERAVLPQPGGWFHRLLRRNDQRPVVLISDWSVEIRESTETEQTDAGSPGNALRNAIVALSQTRWLGGPAVLTNGQVRLSGRVIEVPQIVILEDRIDARAAMSGWEADARIERAPADRIAARIDARPGGWFLEAEAAPVQQNWAVTGQLGVSTQALQFSATFGPDSPLPLAAALAGAEVEIPLPEKVPGNARGDIEVRWEDGVGRFDISIEGTTRLPTTGDSIPLSAELHGQFTTNHLDIAQLHVESEPLNAHLSQPIRVPIARPWETPPTTLSFSARLDSILPDIATGNVRGSVMATGDMRQTPRLTFEFMGEDVAHAETLPARVLLRGMLEWPRATLQAADVMFSNGTHVTAQGEADLAVREVISAQWSFEGEPPLTKTNGSFKMPGLSARGTARGAFTNIISESEVRTLAPLQISGLRPLTAEAQFAATGTTVERLTLRAATDLAELNTVASVQPPRGPEGAWRVQLSSLAITSIGDPLPALELVAPTEFSWAKRAGDAPTNAIVAEISEARLRGHAGEMSIAAAVTWPRGGQLDVSGEAFSAAFATNWIEEAPAWLRSASIDSLTLASDSRQGFLDGRFEVRARAPVPNVGELALEASGSAGRGGVQLSDLRVKRDDRYGLVATLELPIQINLGNEGVRPEVIRSGKLGGMADVAADSWLWDLVAARTPVRVVNPVAHLEFAGTAELPRVSLAAQSERIEIGSLLGEATTLNVEELQVRTALSPREVVIEHLGLKVEGQEAGVSARVPLVGGSDRWWVQPPRPDWFGTQAELSIPAADLAPVMEHWRDILQPMGALSANLQLHQGELRGWMQITNVAARPIPSVGAVRDVSLRIALDGRRASVESGSATLNGQPLTLQGWLEWLGGTDYTAELRLAGTNLAVLRSTAALVRTDLDLAVLRTNLTTPPLVSGAVQLRDSVVMMDILELVSMDLERPEKRPPYFSIAAEPFATWGLDVHVRGSRFARIVSPAFHGTISADMRLGGTLQNPRLLGEGVVDSGRIIFPFGQLQVEQARLRFTESDPYRPRLEGRAEGMNFGYNVTMSIGGTMTDPELTFSTIPPMSTREALLMLTAGTLPRQEYSFSGSQRIQKVGTYLARDLISTMTGNPSTEPRLTIQSGQRVTSEGRLTYGMEYRLTDRWYLVGEYDRWSQFNAGVRWRILER